jgi:hypothetical protein
LIAGYDRTASATNAVRIRDDQVGAVRAAGQLERAHALQKRESPFTRERSMSFHDPTAGE